jgi:hypothetical protein
VLGVVDTVDIVDQNRIACIAARFLEGAARKRVFVDQRANGVGHGERSCHRLPGTIRQSAARRSNCVMNELYALAPPIRSKMPLGIVEHPGEDLQDGVIVALCFAGDGRSRPDFCHCAHLLERLRRR